jgi:hypothetical protein
LKTGEAAPTEDGTYGTSHAESQSRWAFWKEVVWAAQSLQVLWAKLPIAIDLDISSARANKQRGVTDNTGAAK